jgi:DNA helicase-2/ATP-dependent DNA helicase PcrA
MQRQQAANHAPFRRYSRVPDYEDPLDEQQRAAVEATEPAIAVLAGPGSGKTRTLSYRSRHLLLSDPDARALLLTFTNKAAAEMKFRAIGVAAVASNRIQASTFHTFGMRTLRSHGPLVGIEPDFELIDEDEQKELAREALGSDAGIEGWSRARIRRLTPSPRVAEVGASYEEAKRAQNVVDFDDLVVYTAQLFEEHEDVARAYGARFPHLLVDEFQDTNPTQFAIVQSLAAHAQTVSVFADDDQAIFGWAGAETANIRRFVSELGAREFPLTINYRCRRAIVDRANALIAAEPTASGRQMQADKRDGEVEVRVFDDVFDEAVAITDEIERTIDDGDLRPSDICVLARSAPRAAQILPTLLDRGLPAQRWMGAGFDTAERRLLATCMAVVRGRLNPRQLSRVCQLLSLAEDDQPPETRALLESHEDNPLAAALLEISTLAAQEAPPIEVVRQVRVAVEIARPEMVVHADTLIETVEAFEQHDPEFTLEHLLADLMLGGASGPPTEGGGIKVATIHRTKGLQWPRVYLVGLEEGWLPNWYAKTDEQISEERKLCFVGVCRAEDQLFITRIRSFKGHPQPPSRFLQEMGL